MASVNRRAKSVLGWLTGDSIRIDVEGLTIEGGVDTWTILCQIRDGTFEPFESELFLRQLRPGMVVLDVGANVGYYALLASRRVGKEGAVYAFEPHPRTCASLKRNVARNSASNVRVLEAAVSRTAGIEMLHLSGTATHSGLHASMEDADPRSVQVDAIAIDDLELERVGLVKIDIEGEEPSALEGMRRTLERSPDACVLLEFSPAALRAAGHDPNEFGARLKRKFERVEVVDERTRGLFPLELPVPKTRLNLRCERPLR
jgi:FkbM family methyltransferase